MNNNNTQTESAMSKTITAAAKWDTMSAEERTTWLRNSDPTMKAKAWAPLIKSMSSKDFGELSHLQSEMVADLL